MPHFTDTEGQQALTLARQAMEHRVRTGGSLKPAEKDLPESFLSPGAAFVTLYDAHEQLRGCIGEIWPEQPLYRSIIHGAEGAALRDPRFRAVQAEELRSLRLEVSLLTPPEKYAFQSEEQFLRLLEKTHPGVYLKALRHHSTFLPQVWAKLSDPEFFLRQLHQKGHFPAKIWDMPDGEIFLYDVEKFEE